MYLLSWRYRRSFRINPAKILPVCFWFAGSAPSLNVKVQKQDFPGMSKFAESSSRRFSVAFLMLIYLCSVVVACCLALVTALQSHGSGLVYLPTFIFLPAVRVRIYNALPISGPPFFPAATRAAVNCTVIAYPPPVAA